MTIQTYPAPKSQVTSSFWRYTATGGETTLTGIDNAGVQLAYLPGQEQFFLNGVMLMRGTDYTATNGTSIVGLSPLTAGDYIQITTYSNFTVTNIPVGSISGAITNLQLANSTFTLGSTLINLGDTKNTIAGLTLTSPTINNPIVGTQYSTSVPLIVKGATGQAVNLQEWNINGGTPVLTISTTGAVVSKDYIYSNATNSGLRIGTAIDGSTGQFVTDGTNSYLDFPGYIAIRNSSGFVERMRINSSGNVGIGDYSQANVAAMQKLDVVGNINMNTLGTTAGRKTGYSIGVGDAGLVGQKAAITFTGNAASTYGILTDIIFSNMAGDYYNAGLAERMRIDSNGKVSIGATASSNRLTIGGLTNGTVIIGDTIQSLTTGTNQAGAIYFGAYDGTTTAPTAAIEASWMNTTNPSISIGVTRDGNKTYIVQQYNSQANFYNAGVQTMFTDSNHSLMIGYTTNQNASYKLQVNSQIFATSSAIATSDAKFKENVDTIKDGLSMIDALNPVAFNWKKHDVHNFVEGKTVGFIAQEVREALKDYEWIDNIVKENKNEETGEEFLGLVDSAIIPLLVSAVKELSAKVKALEAK